MLSGIFYTKYENFLEIVIGKAHTVTANNRKENTMKSLTNKFKYQFLA